MGIDQVLAIPRKSEIKGVSQGDYYSYRALFGQFLPAIFVVDDEVVKMIVNPFGRKYDRVNVGVVILSELAFQEF